ncbi:hypothetical protein AOLI_G00330710 [Acnodon oligacanthus]
MDLRETKWTESVGPGSSPEGIPESRGYILRCSVYHLAARCLAHQKPRRRPAKLQRNAALPGLSVRCCSADEMAREDWAAVYWRRSHGCATPGKSSHFDHRDSGVEKEKTSPEQ